MGAWYSKLGIYQGRVAEIEVGRSNLVHTFEECA